jgi:hypothetical protein
MKRSEMVEKIAEAMYERSRNQFMPPWDEAPSIYARGHLNDADTMLKAVEEFGMTPPKTDIRVENRMIDGQMALIRTSLQKWDEE